MNDGDHRGEVDSSQSAPYGRSLPPPPEEPRRRRRGFPRPASHLSRIAVSAEGGGSTQNGGVPPHLLRIGGGREVGSPAVAYAMLRFEEGSGEDMLGIGRVLVKNRQKMFGVYLVSAANQIPPYISKD